MSVLGSFTGSDQKHDLERAKTQSDADLKSGFDMGQSNYSDARNYFNDYARTGGLANKLYADATGVNGQGAYDTIAHNFTYGDPFRQSNEDYANQQLMKTFAARGQAYSGNAMMAAARGSLERGSTDWNNWLNRVQGESDRGFQASGAQAGITTGMGDMANQYGINKAGSDITFGNAMAGYRSTLMNNLAGAAGVGVKAFTPGWGGSTPIGNIGNAMASLIG